MNAKSLFTILAALAVLGACSTNSNINEYTQADPFHKTIVVSGTTGILTEEVKATLKQNDWQFGDERPIPDPRYTMVLTYNDVGRCPPRLDPLYVYDLSITDNKIGGHIFGMHGRDCRHTILENLDAFLKNKPLPKSSS